MKRILCTIAAALLLASAAMAEEYQSIADMPVPERWTAEYQSGRRTVTVDIQPTIPDAEAMPVLKTVPAFWLPEAKEGAAWSANVTGYNDAFHLMTENVFTTSHLGLMYPPFEEDAPLIDDAELTLARLRSKVEAIFSEMEGESYGYDVSHIDYLNPHKAKGGPAVLMNFFQTLRGVPLWNHAINSITHWPDNDLSYWPGYTLTMQDGDSYELSGRTVRETAVLAQDVPLCSFEQVKDAIEKELEAGHIRAVYAVDLGYALFNEPGVTRRPGTEWILSAEFYAVPVWRVVCIYTSDSGKKLDHVFANPATSLYYKSLFINAQTGELLDPDQSRNGCADYSGFIAWEDVQ